MNDDDITLYITNILNEYYENQYIITCYKYIRVFAFRVARCTGVYYHNVIVY